MGQTLTTVEKTDLEAEEEALLEAVCARIKSMVYKLETSSFGIQVSAAEFQLCTRYCKNDRTAGGNVKQRIEATFERLHPGLRCSLLEGQRESDMETECAKFCRRLFCLCCPAEKYWITIRIQCREERAEASIPTAVVCVEAEKT